MRRARPLWLIVAVVLLGLWAWSQSPHDTLPAPDATSSAHSSASTPPFPATPPVTTPASRYPTFLPNEAHAVLDAIARGGPYDHRQDDNVFQNREHRLPARPRGYYREYTVPTPGSPDRGPRRIVTGGGGGSAGLRREYWYSADHYRGFRRFDVDREDAQ